MTEMMTRSARHTQPFWKHLCSTIVKKHIHDYVEKNSNKNCNDIILGDIMNENPKIARHVNIVKYIQIKIGLIWQEIIGSIKGVENLKTGHSSSLDLFITRGSKKYAMELKNSFNTDNSSSRKHNFSKISKFIQNNKSYTGIYGIINARDKTGIDKVIKVDNIKVRILSGIKLLNFIFGSETNIILSEFKRAIANILVDIGKI